MHNLIEKYIKNQLIENKINIKYDDIFLSNWRSKIFENSKEKEIINSISSFFYFINNKEAIDFLEKVCLNLNLNLEEIKKNNDIYMKDDDDFFLSIFILKAFSYYSPIYRNEFGDYKNSDKILDICVELYKKYCIYNNIRTDNIKKIRIFFFKTIVSLIENNVIKEKNIIQFENKNKFSCKYWKIDIITNINSIDENLIFSYHPYYVKYEKNNSYLIGVFFWNVYEIYNKNFYSNIVFKVIDQNYIDLLIKQELYIDKENIGWIRLLIEEEIGIEIKNKTVANISKELIDLINDKNWDIDTKEKIKHTQKKYSKKIEYNNLLIFLNYYFEDDEKIYFPFFFDFRGRKYYSSIIGPTFCKISRFIFHYGIYKDEDFSKKILIQRILFFENIIISFCKHYNYVYKLEYLESIFWVLIGIGKTVIDKSKIFIKDVDIIDNAIRVLNKGINEIKLKQIDKIEIISYIKILENLGEKKMKKKIIIKDGTASVYQMSMLILSPKNEESLKYVNLYNIDNNWVDTYSLISNKFIDFYLKKKKSINLYNSLKEDLDSKEILKELLKRSNTKKSLMTIPYSIGIDNCYNKFLENLKESYSELEFKNINKDNLKIMFIFFYKYAKIEIEKRLFYKKTSKAYANDIIKKFKKTRNILLKTETGETDLKYYKIIKKPIDVIYSINVIDKKIKKRITKQFKIPSDSIDISQTRVSLGANLRHFYEADILRKTELALGYSVISIHDGELIDFNSCSRLIIIKNDIFQKEINKNNLNFKIWSMFILI